MQTLNYPGKVDAIGQVVGPNHLGEFFVAVDAEVVQVHTNIGRDLRADTETRTVVTFEELTKERQALTTHEARQEFVLRTNNLRRGVEEGTVASVPEWHEMRRFEDAVAMQKPHLW